MATYVPVVGDKIRIEAEMEGYKSVMAEDVIPGPPTLLNFAVENYFNQSYYYRYFQERLKVTFRDDPSAGNCYLIRFARGYPNMIMWGTTGRKRRFIRGLINGIRSLLILLLNRYLKIKLLFWIR